MPQVTMAANIRLDRTILASPEAVFDAATHVPAWSEVIPAIERIEMLTDGPVGLGTRFRETRTMFGREATEVMEFVEFERPRRYVLAAESHGARYRTVHTIEATRDGSKLTMEFHITPLTVMAKVMAVVCKPFMKKMGQMCARDMDALKTHIESGAAPQR